jgi:hypothetical protein
MADRGYRRVVLKKMIKIFENFENFRKKGAKTPRRVIWGALNIVAARLSYVEKSY